MCKVIFRGDIFRGLSGKQTLSFIKKETQTPVSHSRDCVFLFILFYVIVLEMHECVFDTFVRLYREDLVYGWVVD